MKAFLLSFALAISAFSQNTNEPTELTTLRNSWTTHKEAAAKSADEKYVISLSAMKDKFLRAGNLEAAVSVDSELKSLMVDQNNDSKESVQVTSSIAYSALILNVGVDRLSGLDSDFEWISNDITGWEFTQKRWRSGDAIRTVTFLENCEIYLTLLGSFKTSSDTVKKLPVAVKAKGAFLGADRQWYRVTGKKGDSFQCDGEECLIVAKSFKKN